MKGQHGIETVLICILAFCGLILGEHSSAFGERYIRHGSCSINFLAGNFRIILLGTSIIWGRLT